MKTRFERLREILKDNPDFIEYEEELEQARKKEEELTINFVADALKIITDANPEKKELSLKENK